MDKYKILLLNNLKYDTFCRLGISKIHGIGVFAIKDIPRGRNPFGTSGGCLKYNCVELTDKDIQDLPDGIKKMIRDYIASHNYKYCIPLNGLNSIDISFYMNHSINNNVGLIKNPQCEFTQFITQKDIRVGEELTINYDHFHLE